MPDELNLLLATALDCDDFFSERDRDCVEAVDVLWEERETCVEEVVRFGARLVDAELLATLFGTFLFTFAALVFVVLTLTFKVWPGYIKKSFPIPFARAKAL